MFTYSNLNEAFWNELNNISVVGKNVESRGSKQKEVLFRSFTIQDPTDLDIVWPSRKFNATYTLAEFLWYLSRNPNSVNIGKFARIWLNIKDDEDNVESNYGCYVFGSQWDWAVKELLADKDSRRATFVIGQPYHKTKNPNDIPCTQYLQFFIRDNKLHMGTCMRSNDIVFGMSNDLQIGTYHHHAGSLHLYEMHYDMAAQILEGDSYSENYSHCSGIFTLKPNITLEYIQKNELYLPSKDMTKEEIGEYAKTVSKSLFIWKRKNQYLKGQTE